MIDSSAIDTKILVSMITQALPDVIAIYVFGSAVTGEAHSESDLDVAVPPTGKIPSLQRWELQSAL